METSEELLTLLNEKVSFGENLIIQLEVLNEIDGVMKLQRKIRQEIEFLRKLQKSKKVKIEQLSCSNLRHLGAMVDSALRPGVIAVCKIFHVNDTSKLVIDIISEEGRVWTKVIARNPKSLSALSAGKASYGARSILDQAEDYLECAKLYPCMYQPPKIVFEFMSGIEESLANKLKAVGVIVKGEILPNSKRYEDSNDSWDEESSDEECLQDRQESSFKKMSECMDKHPEIKTLNLDVTAMMAYVSNMTNGHCNYVFKQEVLTQQSAWEAERPVKPVLERLFKDSKSALQHIARCTSNSRGTPIAYSILELLSPLATKNYTIVLQWIPSHVGLAGNEEADYLARQAISDDKSLVCCKTAWDDFEKIVNNLGGAMEIKRTEELKNIVRVYPDHYGGEDDYPRKNLKVRGHVRLRSKIIFNFGHRIKALTVSANEGFVRAAMQQGITYASFVHESRALTEGKEPTATKISL